MFALILITTTLLQLIIAQRTPMISYITPEQIKNIGETAELQCSVTYYTAEYSILWVKINKESNDQVPLSLKTNLIIQDSRFSVTFVSEPAIYTLQIKDIQETDAGFYECQIPISLVERIRDKVELKVLRPPFISDNSTRAIVARTNDEILLECYANGYPPPKISWHRENWAILPMGGVTYSGHILKIVKIRKEDRGMYYCIAENNVGQVAKRKVSVEVEFLPIIWTPRSRSSQAMHFDMDLECDVEAYPPPIISWLKDDVKLRNNRHYSISHFATGDQFTVSIMRVISMEKHQYGKYVCSATNKLGTAETSVELFETIIPICPPACGPYLFS